MKRSSTVYLEDIFWDMICNYQNENNLSSRNDALALILKEWEMLKKIDLNNIKVNDNKSVETVIKQEVVDVETKEESKPSVDPRISSGLNQLFNNVKQRGD